MTEHLKDKGSKLQTIIAGSTAGLVSRFVVAPLDVIKIRLQLQSHSLDIVRDEGFTALWKGNVPAEIMYMVYSAAQFTAYRATAEAIRPYLGDNRTNPRIEAQIAWIAGTVAGLAGTTMSYPLDLLRTRFAAQGNDRVYKSFFRAFGEIYRDEGLQGFFRGIVPTLLNAGPGMGIYFLTYEALRPLTFIAKTTVFPLDIVRKRMQVQGPTRGKYIHKNIPEYTSTMGAIRTILATEGIRGLYRGLFVTLLKHAPSSGVTLWVYESTLRNLIKLDNAAERNI
ncbi:unnamed protein product [Parascedosporium putredinis]|uniref:Mitochondrial thiamine pyrophosphate carrier 1 n=1 Tax=Parascedosporium putredinis TaxID=1442378 RepID=A0A9P1MAT9_9PEZI|nr:unnamed protein product [Parascedosporium putredinis]CAI7998275.1 unnamed protein product [Parascedosporium putredinis]